MKMSTTDNGQKHAELEAVREFSALREREAVLAAQLLQKLIRSRRFHLDEFLDGDGPYWISIGLYVDGDAGIETTAERIMNFADESPETSRHIVRQMIDRDIVQRYKTPDGNEAFRLTPSFAVQFTRFLGEQFKHMRSTCARIS
ncbi:hypothetical protein [Sphingopyxis panaciterrae]